MTNNILVADDSLTIQKVVTITLASRPYNLKKAVNETELFEQLKSEEFDLLLLDFSLSETKTGYELVKEIKSICPTIEIMVMLGTFDTIDEAQFLESSISDKVIKPFESEKFITKCEALIEKQNTTHENALANEQDSDLFGEDETDELSSGWEVDSSKQVNEESSETLVNEGEFLEDEKDPFGEDTEILENNQREDEGESENLLQSEMLGWGIEIPPVIGQEAEEVTLMPPVIDSSSRLDFGTGEQIKDSEEKLDIQLDEETPLNGPKSKLVPIQDLSLDSDEDDYDEDEDSQLDSTKEIPKRNLSEEVQEAKASEDFWEVDDNGIGETVDKDQLSSLENSIEITQTQAQLSNLEENDDIEEKVPEETAPSLEARPSFSEDELVEKLKDSLKPIIRDLVKDFCKEKVEQVAWEIIPDLAENVIKKEVKDIAQEVKDSNV